MKHSFFFSMLIAAAAIAFSSCNKVELQGQDPNEGTVTSTVFHITASPLDTKTVFGDKSGNAYQTKWTINKQVRFAIDNTKKGVDVIPDFTGEGASASADFNPEFINAPESGTIYAFSPVGDFYSDPKVPGFTSFVSASNAIYVTIPSAQTPLANSVDESAQAMAASQTYTDVEAPINMSFHHIVAYGKMTISNFSGTIKSVELQFPENIAGLSCKYAYESGEITEGLDSKTITLNPANVVDNVFWFALAPTAGATGEMKIIITDNNDDTYTKTIDLTKKALPFEIGKVSSFSASFSGIAKDVKESFYTWDLTKASYSSASTALVTWTSPIATMTNAKGSGTNANNYLGGTNSDSRFYKNNLLTITPGTGCTVTKVVFNTSTPNYIASGWNNASTNKALDNASITVTPTDGSQPFYVTPTGTTKVTSVQVYYVAAAAKTLSSIALSGIYPTEFDTGDEFSHEGMTVTATYDDATTADVTSNAAFSGYDMDTPGQQTVTVTYTEVETTKTAQYTITVTATPMILADDITDVPAIGGDFEHTYTAKYFITDDVEVAAVDGKVVTEAIVEDGGILFTVAPNYTATAKNGTITLQSASNNEVTKTINVSQVKSSLSVSDTEIVIPYNATTKTFTLTSKEMGWNVDVSAAEGMNLSVDKNSGAKADAEQTITITSTTEASTSEVLSLGTIYVYRNGNTSDSQKKTITVKKGQDPGSASTFYTKVSSITPGKKYVFVSTYSGTKFIVSGTVASKSLTLVAASQYLNNDKIPSTDETDNFAITISGTSGSYTLTNASNKDIKVSSGDISDTSTASQTWSATQQSDNSWKFVNSSQSSRALFIGNSGKSCKNYATSNFGNSGYASTYFELYELQNN